jgi:hypothetical protein
MARVEHPKDDKFRLSYSAASDLIKCQQHYAWKKVHKIAPDPDLSVNTFFTTFGSAYHLCHEYAMHEIAYFEDKWQEYIGKAMQEVGLPTTNDNAPVLMSAVMSSMMLWKETGLRVIACEIEIWLADYVGYIDFVAVDPTSDDGNGVDWWIGDLKTAGSAEGNGGPRLRRDPQLALYVAQKDYIAAKLGLNPARFKGCLWRETSRTKLVVRPNEKPDTYAKRCPSESRIYVIPVEIMGEEPVIVHKLAYDIAAEIHAGKRIPMRAYGRTCSDWYGSTCPYWSQCYGKLSSESTEGIGYIGLVREKGRKAGDKSIEISNANLTGYRFGLQEEVVPEDVAIIRHPAPVVFDFDL